MLKYNIGASSGNLNTLTSGSEVDGNAVFLGGAYRKVASLSALVTVLAQTNTLTIAAKWQVSNDKSTWVDVANGSQNAAAVVLQTGTSGTDVAVSKAIPAPDAIYGWKYARIALVTGGTTGATADTYAMSYCYHQMTGAEAPV